MTLTSNLLFVFEFISLEVTFCLIVSQHGNPPEKTCSVACTHCTPMGTQMGTPMGPCQLKSRIFGVNSDGFTDGSPQEADKHSYRWVLTPMGLNRLETCITQMGCPDEFCLSVCLSAARGAYCRVAWPLMRR